MTLLIGLGLWINRVSRSGENLTLPNQAFTGATTGPASVSKSSALRRTMAGPTDKEQCEREDAFTAESQR